MGQINIGSIAEFNNQLASAGGKLVVVNFEATWCATCKKIQPAIEGFTIKYPGAVFLKVDIDEVPLLGVEYLILAMPTFVYIKNSTEVTRVLGVGLTQIEQAIQNNL